MSLPWSSRNNKEQQQFGKVRALVEEQSSLKRSKKERKKERQKSAMDTPPATASSSYCRTHVVLGGRLFMTCGRTFDSFSPEDLFGNRSAWVSHDIRGERWGILRPLLSPSPPAAGRRQSVEYGQPKRTDVPRRPRSQPPAASAAAAASSPQPGPPAPPPPLNHICISRSCRFAPLLPETRTEKKRKTISTLP